MSRPTMGVAKSTRSDAVKSQRMTVDDGFCLAAAGGQLLVVFLAGIWGAKNRLALPLSLMCLVLAISNLTRVIHSLTGDPAWLALDAAVAPFGVAFALHFILVFVGARERLKGLLMGAHAWAAVLALVAFSPWVESHAWAAAFLLDLGACSVVGFILLRAHWQRSVRPEEKVRTR